MRLLSIFVFVAFCAFMGCQKDDVSKVNPNADYVINIGSTFQVDLTSNPSTGFKWQWTNHESVSIVDTIAHGFTADHPELLGSSGTENWTFIGRNTGVDSVKLIYIRNGDIPDSPISKTITVQVN